MGADNPNRAICLPPGPYAPPYQFRLRQRHWTPVQIASQQALNKIPGGSPYFIPIFDSVSLFQNTTAEGGEGVSGQLSPLQSYQNNFPVTVDFWWLQMMANFSSGSVSNPPVAWQLYAATQDPQSQQQATTVFQKTPIAAGSIFGTASEPLELDEPQLLPAGTELICQVQNLLNAALTVQIVLMGYLATPGLGKAS